MKTEPAMNESPSTYWSKDEAIADIGHRKSNFFEWHGYEAPPALVAAWESGKMVLPEVPKLAKEFSRLIRETLPIGELLEANERNRTPEYAGCCATHDFTDSNVLMGEAMAILGYDTAPGDRDLFEATNDYAHVWNAAWDLAKQERFLL